MQIEEAVQAIGAEKWQHGNEHRHYHDEAGQEKDPKQKLGNPKEPWPDGLLYLLRGQTTESTGAAPGDCQQRQHAGQSARPEHVEEQPPTVHATITHDRVKRGHGQHRHADQRTQVNQFLPPTESLTRFGGTATHPRQEQVADHQRAGRNQHHDHQRGISAARVVKDFGQIRCEILEHHTTPANCCRAESHAGRRPPIH